MVKAVFRSLSQRIRAYRNYRRVYDKLSLLSVRELEDIGLRPTDIESVARGRAVV